MPQDAIAILDYGSQYTQLIARRVREAHVYCEIFPWDAQADRVAALNARAFILSGGPNSVYDEGAPTLPAYILDAHVPILGICYGQHLLTQALGGKVVAVFAEREYGPADLEIIDHESALFKSTIRNQQSEISVWMSHGDRTDQLPAGLSHHRPIGQLARGGHGE